MMLSKKLKISSLLILLAVLSLMIPHFGGANQVWASEAQHETHSEHGEQVSEHGSGHGEEHGGGHVSEHGEGHGGGHGGGHDEGHGGGHGGHKEVAGFVTPEMDWRASLPLWALLIPFLAALGSLVIGENDRPRNILVVSATAITMGLLVYMYGPVVNGIEVGGRLYKGIMCHIPYMPGFDLNFKVDPIALLIALVTNFLWLLSTIYATDYMTIEKNHTRYDFCVMATLTADLGVLMAGDFLTMFIFFEGLIIFPYSLVAHKENKACVRGANMYLYLGVVTGLSLLAGIFLFHFHTGSLVIGPVSTSVLNSLSTSTKYTISLLMIIGFGGKAGLFFEHIWLPNAHPVAPTPASTLLSGAMIKAGAYGIIRVVNMLFLPNSFPTLENARHWISMSDLGYIIIWVGVVTMFLAVLSALKTANSKRMLAFHSVSQMGYIILGVGVAAYLGKDGAMGLAGAMYHTVNHALFKASLFLCVGAVYFHTHQLDMYELGGLWRNMPVIAVGLLIAVFGIAGIPGFNGFASKTILHHAILEAYEHSAHFAADGQMDFKLKIAEVIFMITAGGTFASNIKLFMLTFMGERKKKYENVPPAPLAMKISIAMVSFAILFIGLNPNWLLDVLIGPALGYFGYDPASHPYHVLYNLHAAVPHSTIPILYPITNAAGQLGEVLHNLLGGGTAVMLGGMYFVPGMRFGWFHFEPPEKMTLEYYYVRFFRAFRWFCVKPVATFAEKTKGLIPTLLTDIWLPLSKPASGFSTFIGKMITGTLTDTWLPLSRPVSKVSGYIDKAVTGTLTDSWLPLSKPVSKVSESVDHLVTSALTDSWLPLSKPVSKFSESIESAVEHALPMEAKPGEEEDIERFTFKFEDAPPRTEKPWQMVAAKIYMLLSGQAADFDFHVVDGIVNGVGRLAHLLGKLSLLFDTEVIDKFVNGTAKSVDYSSNIVKRTQTGRIQNYLFAILLGMLIIVTLHLMGVLNQIGIH